MQFEIVEDMLEVDFHFTPTLRVKSALR